MSEWVIEVSDFYASRLRRYQKRHQQETSSVLNNLDTYFRALQSGIKPTHIQAGFIHLEPQGVVALDEKGMKGRGKATRLYIYTIEADNVLHLITIGDKDSQKRDLSDCREFVKSIRKRG